MYSMMPITSGFNAYLAADESGHLEMLTVHSE
jgi:hypothetical protein